MEASEYSESSMEEPSPKSSHSKPKNLTEDSKKVLLLQKVPLRDAIKEIDILLTNQGTKWKNIFLSLDQTGKGSLSVMQLFSALQQDYGIDPSHALPLIKSLDVDKMGFISLIQWLNCPLHAEEPKELIPTDNQPKEEVKSPEQIEQPKPDVFKQDPISRQTIEQAWSRLIEAGQAANLNWRNIFLKNEIEQDSGLAVLSLLQNLQSELGTFDSKDLMIVLKDIDQKDSGMISFKDWMAHSPKFEKTKPTEKTEATFEDTKEQILSNLQSGKIIWTDLFAKSSEKKPEEKCVFYLAEEISAQLNLPVQHVFSFLRPFDSNSDGMLGLTEWNQAYLNKEYIADPRRKFLRDLSEKKPKEIPEAPKNPAQTDLSTFEQFQEELFAKLAKGAVKWDSLIKSQADSNSEVPIIPLAESISEILDAPKSHVFKFFRPLDVNQNGMISVSEWNQAHTNPAYSKDPRSAFMKKAEVLKINSTERNQTSVEKKPKLNETTSSKLPELKPIDDLQEIDEINDEKLNSDSQKNQPATKIGEENFAAFIEKMPTEKFNPDAFFLAQVEKNNQISQVKSVSVYSIVYELTNQFPELDPASIFTKIKAKDKKGTGFIDHQDWQDLFKAPKESEPELNYILNQSCIKEEVLASQKACYEKLTAEFKGNEILLLDAFASCPCHEDFKFFKSTAKLTKEISQRCTNLNKSEVFDAISYATKYHYPVVTFGEFIRNLEISIETVEQFKECFPPSDFTEFSSQYSEIIKRFFDLKQHLISINFDPLSPFKDEVTDNFSLMEFQQECDALSYKPDHLATILRYFDADNSGMIESNAFLHYLCPVIEIDKSSPNPELLDAWKESLLKLPLQKLSVNQIYKTFKKELEVKGIASDTIQRGQILCQTIQNILEEWEKEF